MNEQMMAMMGAMGGKPEAPQEQKSLSSMLSDYRKAFGLVREEEKQNNKKNDIWGGAFEVPKGDVGPAWGSRIEMPEELPNYRDDRDSGDPEINKREYEAYMSSHPFVQQYGPKLEKMVSELAEMTKDPKNSMTIEEAQATFLKYFGKMADAWESGVPMEEENDEEEEA